jgi:hypothetical protein
VSNVPGREQCIRAEGAGEEAIPERLSRDDPDVRLAGRVENVLDPFLAE